MKKIIFLLALTNLIPNNGYSGFRPVRKITDDQSCISAINVGSHVLRSREEYMGEIGFSVASKTCFSRNGISKEERCKKLFQAESFSVTNEGKVSIQGLLDSGEVGYAADGGPGLKLMSVKDGYCGKDEIINMENSKDLGTKMVVASLREFKNYKSWMKAANVEFKSCLKSKNPEIQAAAKDFFNASQSGGGNRVDNGGETASK